MFLNKVGHYQFLHIHIQYHAYRIQHKQPLTLLHNRVPTDKVTEYHNITLILILILIQEEWGDTTCKIITKKENIQIEEIEIKHLEQISMLHSLWTMSVD